MVARYENATVIANAALFCAAKNASVAIQRRQCVAKQPFLKKQSIASRFIKTLDCHMLSSSLHSKESIRNDGCTANVIISLLAEF
jgi:hypothetical protein